MSENSEREQLIRKMFISALKETFSHFYRKYEEKLVFEVWAEIMANGGLNDYLSKWIWTPEMTFTEAIDSLHCCRSLIEAMVQQRQEEKKKHKGS
jgi:hypothetical protein